MASSTLTFRKAPELVRDTVSEADTLALARALGRWLKPGDWIALMGGMAAGKTVFARGLAEGMGLTDMPTSPTFALVQIHAPKPGRGKTCLRHADLYRLSSAEIPALEWEELHDDKGVTVVEWAEKAAALWPPQCFPVRLSHRGGDARQIEFYVWGARSAELARRLKEAT